MVGIYISTYCECIRPRVGSHRLAFTTYATGLGPSCSHHPQISSPAPSPASTKTGGHFIGMAMGMSMTSDPQHHSMGGSMNGMSYSHGLFDCIYHTLHRPNFYSNEIIRKVVPAGSKDENGRRSLVANWTCWNLCSPRPAIRTSSCEKKWPSRSVCRNLVSRFGSRTAGPNVASSRNNSSNNTTMPSVAKAKAEKSGYANEQRRLILRLPAKRATSIRPIPALSACPALRWRHLRQRWKSPTSWFHRLTAI